jgi:hypothetical protein
VPSKRDTPADQHRRALIFRAWRAAGAPRDGRLAYGENAVRARPPPVRVFYDLLGAASPCAMLIPRRMMLASDPQARARHYQRFSHPPSSLTSPSLLRGLPTDTDVQRPA